MEITRENMKKVKKEILSKKLEKVYIETKLKELKNESEVLVLRFNKKEEKDE